MAHPLGIQLVVVEQLMSNGFTSQGCEEVEHPAHSLEVTSVQGLTHRCCVGRHD